LSRSQAVTKILERACRCDFGENKTRISLFLKLITAASAQRIDVIGIKSRHPTIND
jgi:hypothetical protein